MYRTGHLFTEEYTGLIDELPSLFMRNRFSKLEVRKQEIEYRTGTEIGDATVKDILRLFHTIRPYLHRYGCEPDDYDAICKQAALDMQRPDFSVKNIMVTMWAVNPKETNGLGEKYR
jgi:hypothetical protein